MRIDLPPLSGADPGGGLIVNMPCLYLWQGIRNHTSLCTPPPLPPPPPALSPPLWLLSMTGRMVQSNFITILIPWHFFSLVAAFMIRYKNNPCGGQTMVFVLLQKQGIL